VSRCSFRWRNRKKSRATESLVSFPALADVRQLASGFRHGCVWILYQTQPLRGRLDRGQSFFWSTCLKVRGTLPVDTSETASCNDAAVQHMLLPRQPFRRCQHVEYTHTCGCSERASCWLRNEGREHALAMNPVLGFGHSLHTAA
jgi:hypothetical protein